MCHCPSSYPGCQGIYPRAGGEVTVPLGTAIDEGYSQNAPSRHEWAPSQGGRLGWLPLGMKSFVSGPDAEGPLQVRLGPISLAESAVPPIPAVWWDAGHFAIPPAGSGQHTSCKTTSGAWVAGTGLHLLSPPSTPASTALQRTQENVLPRRARRARLRAPQEEVKAGKLGLNQAQANPPGKAVGLFVHRVLIKPRAPPRPTWELVAKILFKP